VTCRWDSGTPRHKDGTWSATVPTTNEDRGEAVWCAQNASVRKLVGDRRWDLIAASSEDYRKHRTILGSRVVDLADIKNTDDCQYKACCGRHRNTLCNKPVSVLSCQYMPKCCEDLRCVHMVMNTPKSQTKETDSLTTSVVVMLLQLTYCSISFFLSHN